MTSHGASQYDLDPTEASRLLTLNEVAYRLAISRDTVYRLVHAGSLTPMRVGERLRFRIADIDAYLERNREPGP